MGPYNNSEEDNIPPLYSEALIHRPEECNAMLEMLSSGGGLAVHPHIIGFENGVHPHLDAEIREYEAAIRHARSCNILSYYDFERFVVEFLKSYGYFICGFKHLVAIIQSLQDYEFFRTFIVFPDSTCAAIHGVEVTDNYIRMLI